MILMYSFYQFILDLVGGCEATRDSGKAQQRVQLQEIRMP